MKPQSKAYIFAVLSVLLWATSATAFKLTLRFTTPVSLLFVSSLASLFAIGLVLISTKRIKLLFQVSLKELSFFAILGFLNPFLYYIILFKAYSLIPAQLAQPLNFIWPIMIVLISIPLLKQKIKLKNILAIFISFFGVIIISTKGTLTALHFDAPLGIGLALFSSIVWAMFWVLNVKSKTDGLIKLFYLFIFGFFYIAVFSFLFSSGIKLPNLKAIAGAIYIGFFEMGFTFVTWYYALYFSHTTDKVNNLIYLTPFLSLIFIAMVLGEKILISTVVGLLFILFGIILQHFKLSN